MAKALNIYLAGFMGCGKSAVGRHLARRLKREFFDSDAMIERRVKKPVTRIFKKEGEPRFRRLESQVIAGLGRKSGAVVALGGGALLDSRNRKIVSKGLCVRLTCAEQELWRRLRPRTKTRPLLAGGRKAFRELLRRRRGAYAGADMTVSTTRRGASAAAREIARRLAA